MLKTNLKNIFEILLHENGDYLATIIDNSVITCDDIMEKKNYSDKF